MFLKSAKAMLVVFIVVNSVLMGIQGRPLSIAETAGDAVTAGDDVDFFDWLGLGGIKSSGPSGGGAGHSFHTLGGIKNSGPSAPGAGH
ncbi:uncharacterized protein LOC114719232 [Neltuma alba]|uniref:uncharacterized protein LOC114719232 n=1 Tax=Neltuma alba TaxID=207710 RepID=UPI0010A34BFF|nr:uncharacterized protein LOC114719232 [Prosopis alba]